MKCDISFIPGLSSKIDDSQTPYPPETFLHLFLLAKESLRVLEISQLHSTMYSQIICDLLGFVIAPNQLKGPTVLSFDNIMRISVSCSIFKRGFPAIREFLLGRCNSNNGEVYRIVLLVQDDHIDYIKAFVLKVSSSFFL